MRTTFAVTAIVLTCLCAVWAAQPSPLEALQTLDRASAAFEGTRADHILIQDSLRVLQAVVAQYEQYRTIGGNPKKNSR